MTSTHPISRHRHQQRRKIPPCDAVHFYRPPISTPAAPACRQQNADLQRLVDPDAATRR